MLFSSSGLDGCPSRLADGVSQGLGQFRHIPVLAARLSGTSTCGRLLRTTLCGFRTLSSTKSLLGIHASRSSSHSYVYTREIKNYIKLYVVQLRVQHIYQVVVVYQLACGSVGLGGGVFLLRTFV